MTYVDERHVLAEALERFGVHLQATVAMEECGELVVAISHWLRDRPGADKALAEEVADVELVCATIRLLLHDGDRRVNDLKQLKLERLRGRVEASR